MKNFNWQEAQTKDLKEIDKISVFDALMNGDEALIKVLTNVGSAQILLETLSREEYSQFAELNYKLFNSKKTVYGQEEEC